MFSLRTRTVSAVVTTALVAIGVTVFTLQKPVIMSKSEYPGTTLAIVNEDKLLRFVQELGLMTFNPPLLRRLVIVLSQERQPNGWTVDAKDVSKVKSSYSFRIKGISGELRVWLNPEYYDYYADPDRYNLVLSAKVLTSLHAESLRLRGVQTRELLSSFANDLYRGANSVIGKDYLVVRRNNGAHK